MSSQKKYNSAQIKYIKSKIDIVQVVSKDIQLKKQGNNFFGRCPLCNGTQSLSVSQLKQFGHCFSCGESFDVIGYYQKTKDISFSEAYQEVKVQYNLNDDLSIKKLKKALVRLSAILQGETAIQLNPKANKIISEFVVILSELINDYYVLTLNKTITDEDIDSYIYCFSSIISSLDEKNNDDHKLSNLFVFLIEICGIIKNNDYNIGGLVYITE